MYIEVNIKKGLEQGLEFYRDPKNLVITKGIKEKIPTVILNFYSHQKGTV